MKTLTTAFLILAISFLQAQEYPKSQKELEEIIVKLDAEAFNAYNNCDLEKFKTFFTDDLEFYHDKGGITKTADSLIETMQKNICGKPNWKLRREAVEGTLIVYLMEGYGAILNGEHLFYVTENGIEKITGRAKFTHLWLLQNSKWKMSRVYSFDHRPIE